MKPRVRVALAITAFAGIVATATVAHADVPNPAANQKADSPSVCTADPAGAACENRWIYNLDQGRAAMGLGPYMLPRDFTELASDRQVLILANLDRVAYGVPTIAGIDPSLMPSVSQGVSAGADPLPPPGYPGAGAFGSVWSNGRANIVHAYWAWLYDDGYGSENLDCAAPTDPGCWIHRQAFFVNASSGDVMVMEAAAGKDTANESSYAALVLGRNATAPPPAYTYTWAQAVADGAGTNAYDPGTGRNPLLTIKISGQGSVAGSVSCHHSDCHTSRDPGTRLSLRAKSGSHARFLGWRGACSGKGRCRLTLNGDATVSARFACRSPWRGSTCRSRRG